MQRTVCFLVYALIIAVIVIVTSPSAFADTILTYTGLPFSFTTSPYTTSSHLKVTLDLAGPLPPLTGPPPQDFQVDPISFSISDGIDTITNSTATASFFQFATFPDGSIMGWTIIADAVIRGTPLALWTQGGVDVGQVDPCVDCVSIIDGPMNPLNQPSTVIAGSYEIGRWAVPEPPSLLLLLLGIAAGSVAMIWTEIGAVIQRF